MSKVKKRTINRTFVHMRDKFPLIFIVGLLVLITTSTIGIVQVVIDTKGQYTIPDALYGIFQILQFEAGNITDVSTNWSFLGISRIAAPLLTIIFSISGILILFTEAFQRLNLRRRKDHIVLFGFGANTREYIRNLGENADNCVVVTSELTQEEIVFLKEYRVLHFKDSFSSITNTDRDNNKIDDGTFLNHLLCKRVGIIKAKHILALTNDDSFNIKAANTVSTYLNKNGIKEKKIACGISNLLIFQQIAENGLFPNEYIQPINLDTICAHDALKVIQPLRNILADSTNKSFKPIHFVVLGFGAFGQAFVKSAAEVSLHSDTDKIPFTIIDSELETNETVDKFEGLFPYIDNVIDIESFSADIQSKKTLNKLFEIAENAKKNNNRPVCVITLNDNNLALAQIMNLAMKMTETEFEFYVRLSDNDPNEGWVIKEGATHIKDENSPWEYLKNVNTFGNEKDLYTDENLFNIRREKLAKNFHETYSPKKSWQDLDASRRYSNYCAVEHIFHKLSSLAFPSTIADDKIEDLAKLEHARWNAERYTNGWKHTEGKKDVFKKLNPCLTTWDKLPDIDDEYDYQEYDRISVRTMATLIENGDYSL